MSVGEAHAAVGEAVDMWRLKGGLSVGTHIAETQVVGDDQYDIRMLLSEGDGRNEK